ncbi:hypothetical protein FACS189427_00770 [Planctomycetales bacterium]|nr:hypothetical protein FACS189427_00770 [Planctomycetales bacterium]
MPHNLQNRRYIGNKYKLLPFIDLTLREEGVVFDSFADMFAGTGVVSEYFMAQGKQCIINDSLYSNYIFYTAWLSNLEYDSNKVAQWINYYNASNTFVEDNYFSDTFSNTYFHYEDAKRIGSIRQQLEKHKADFTLREFAILLSSLLYTTDRIANTVGHFEAFLSTPPRQKGIILEKLNLLEYKKNHTSIRKMQTNL